MSGNPLSNESVAERLKLVRKAVAGTQTAFCKRIGIEIPRWNNFERGYPLSKNIGILLVQKIPGLTLDWLFLEKRMDCHSNFGRSWSPPSRSEQLTCPSLLQVEGEPQILSRWLDNCAACELRADQAHRWRAPSQGSRFDVWLRPSALMKTVVGKSGKPDRQISILVWTLI